MDRRFFLGLASGAALTAGAAALLVPDFARRVQRRLAPVSFPLRTHTVQLAYGTGPDRRIDLFRTRWTPGVRPVSVVFHGGGWRRGRRDSMVQTVCRRYLEMGYVVANLEYRRQGIAPAAEEAIEAVKWVSANIGHHAGDARNVVLHGESAGGHLALMAAFTSGIPVRAVVNFFGIADLAAMRDDANVRKGLPSDGGVERKLSPLTHVRPGVCAVLSVHCVADPVVPFEQSAVLTERLREAGVRAEIVPVPGGEQSYTELEMDAAFARVRTFLETLPA